MNLHRKRLLLVGILLLCVDRSLLLPDCACGMSQDSEPFRTRRKLPRINLYDHVVRLRNRIGAKARIRLQEQEFELA